MNIIGIDFGTSTTVMRVMDSRENTEDGIPECKPVTMSQSGEITAPTLMRVSGGKYTYGHDASHAGKGTLYKDFKLLLRSGEPEERELGIQLLNRFYTYLYHQFDSQKNYLFTDLSQPFRTVVSYPSQWNDTQKESVLCAARLSGFTNVTGMDEASAGVNCMLYAKHRELETSGLLEYGKPLHILVIDMGAGTTDLAFVDLTVTEETKTEIVGTWPPTDSAHIYGGSHMDARFSEYLRNWLQNNGISAEKIENILSSQSYQIKQWKEQTVSVLLEADKTVEDCSAIENIISLFVNSPVPMPGLDRQSFEAFFEEELEAFADVIKSAPQNMREQTDLVFLTGGNCAWYWVPDVLCRPEIGLPGIAGNPRRIMKMDLPNETVARGMIYPPVRFTLAKPSGSDALPEKNSLPEPACTESALPKDASVPPSPNGESLLPSAPEEPPEAPDPAEPASALAEPHGNFQTSSLFPLSPADYDRAYHYQNRISAGKDHTAAILHDQTVLTAGSNRYGQCYTVGVKDVIAVAAAEQYTAFLKKDGRVEIRGGLHKKIRQDVEAWENCIAIAADSDFLIGLTPNGRVLEAGRKKRYCSGWQNITAVAAGDSLAVGLKKDGTVTVAGDPRYGRYDVSQWKDIAAVAVGYKRVIGLKKDGTVVIAGNPAELCCRTEDWHDIIAVSAGFAHTVGLRKDGSVVAAGYQANPECRVSGWKDMIAVSAGYDDTVGLTSDGTLVICGRNRNGRCKVAKWKLF